MYLRILLAGLWFAVYKRLAFQRMASQRFREKCWLEKVAGSIEAKEKRMF